MTFGSGRIHWKRVFIAAIVSELLVFAIYCLALRYARFILKPIAFVDFFGVMFLAGVWVAHRLRSKFVLHGFLVGVVASLLYVVAYIPWIVVGKLPYDYGLGAYQSFLVAILGGTLGGLAGGNLKRSRGLRLGK